jgi:hypothetical protein
MAGGAQQGNSSSTIDDQLSSTRSRCLFSQQYILRHDHRRVDPVYIYVPRTCSITELILDRAAAVIARHIQRTPLNHWHLG